MSFNARQTVVLRSDNADDKENRSSQEEGKGGESLTTGPVDPEVEAEAFENYLFGRMMTYDGDSAFQLVRLRLRRFENLKIGTAAEIDKVFCLNKIGALVHIKKIHVEVSPHLLARSGQIHVEVSPHRLARSGQTKRPPYFQMSRQHQQSSPTF